MIAPPRLRPGETVGVVAPSGPVLQRQLRDGLRALERAGFQVALGRRVFERRGHLAGSDRGRLEDLNRMLRDPDVRCVLMARGGYGAMRIAAGVDWDAMRRDPKIFAGFSDATFLHLGFGKHSGVRTLHGPNLHGLTSKRPGDLKRWLAWVTNPSPSLGVRALRASRRIAGPSVLVRGRVLGGNLVLLHYAVGTDEMPSLSGAILFLEEVAEPPYKIDGMLTQLGRAGMLTGVRGVALGAFAGCVPRPGRRELPLAQVLRDHLSPLGVPVRGGIRAGHGRWNASFPLGARAGLDPRRGVLMFEEGLVS